MAYQDTGWSIYLLFVCMLYLPFINGNFISFKPGFEYEYKVDSKSSIKSTGNFHMRAKVGFINVKDIEDAQEVFLRVHSFTISRDSSNPVGQDADFSKWFSFVITREGEIKSVLHSITEDEEILAIKKGMAAMFAAKLRHEDENTMERTERGWQYHVQEFGHEGPHNATYVIQQHPDGKMFIKMRHKHPLIHATSKYTKTMYFNQDLDNIHTVHVVDEFSAMRHSAPGYDPYEGQRPTKPANDFSKLEYPEMSGFGNGKLEFISKHKLHDIPDRKWIDVATGSIHVQQATRKPIRSSTPEVVLAEITGNLTIMRQQPYDKANHEILDCARRLTDSIELLNDREFKKLAGYYLTPRPGSWKQEKDRNHIMDAIASTGTDRAQTILTKLVLNNPNPDTDIVLRLLVHIVSLDQVPNQTMLSKLLQLAFQPVKSPVVLRSGRVYHRIILTIGSIVRKLNQAGRHEEAVEIITKIENMLGYHDPYLFRKRRSVMNASEIVMDDTWRVNLLGALGNARMEQSYEFIISHINSSNSQWIKRAGVHALRGYNHNHAARMMLERAMYDDNPVVRYEALIQYQSHPKAKRITPYHTNINSSSNSSVYYNPWDLNAHILGRQKRGVKVYDDFLGDGIGFALESPAIDWKLMLGVEAAGASFGILMRNLMDLKISLLSGHAIVDIHDEAFARLHLGIIGLNLDFFLARICFKGSMKYEINILKEFGIDNVKDIVKVYDSVKSGIVDNIKVVVDFFRDIINGKITMDTIISDFKKALEELPNRVLNLGKKATEAMLELGEIDTADLPPFIVPVKRFLTRVTTFYNDIKKDVLGFYNRLFETVTVIIPRAGKQIWTAINDVINAFKHFMNDPQTAVRDIGRSVISIGLEVKRLIDAVHRIKDACFFTKGNKPYWFDLKGELEDLDELRRDTERALSLGGKIWLERKSDRGMDQVAKFTKGKITMSDLKQQVLKNLTQIVNDILRPLNLVEALGGRVFKTFTATFNLVTAVKDAFDKLKAGYQTARDLVDRLFGPKCHKNFPKKYRTPGDICRGSGTYPSSLGKGTEYSVDGVDVLIERGHSVVAPFPGKISRTSNSKEVSLKAEGGSLKDTEIIITNVIPNGNIQREPSMIQAGSEIGKAAGSVCGKKDDHVHLAMRRTTDGGIISPAKYLPPRVPGIPGWVQECNDYKLVWKFDTIAEGPIIGEKGKEEEEEEPERNGDDIKFPTDLGSPSSFVDAQNPSEGLGDNGFGDGYSMFQKTKEKAPNFKDKFKGAFDDFLKKPSKFLEKYSIRKLKIGAIINLLDMLGLAESKASLANVMLRIKEILDNTHCTNPHQMTVDQLRSELTERGKPTWGNRQVMIDRLTAKDNKCPTMTLDLPKNVYCTFDQYCLGFECCVSFKLFVFLKTYKIYARLEPCTLIFIVGVKGVSEKRFNATKDIYGGFNTDYKPGVSVDILGGVELIIRCNVEKSETAMLASISVGFCSTKDNDNCLLFTPILDDAILPVPICNNDGTLTIPDVDYRDVFSREKTKKMLTDSAKKLAEETRDFTLQEVMKQLGIPEDLLNQTPPCSRPEMLTDAILKERLVERKLTINGSREQLLDRLTYSEKSCRILNQTIVLPTIKNDKLNKLIYLQISDDCLHIQACLDVKLTTHLLNFTKSFQVYVKLDPCNYILTVGFEKYSRTIILIGYDWGREEKISIGDSISVVLTIHSNAAEKVFIINVGGKIESNGNTMIDGQFIDEMKIPIPICNNNFTLPGSGTIADFARAMGGKLSSAALDLILKKLGLNRIFGNGICQMATKLTMDCPWAIDVEKYLPVKLQDKITCAMADSCFGLHCCVDYRFNIPYVDEPIEKSLLVFVEFEPCTFVIDIGFGTFRYKETLLTYDWGTPLMLTIGTGTPAPITITYTISQYSRGFVIDLNILACIPIDGKKFCFPEDGINLMKETIIPACDTNIPTNITDLDFSLDAWKEKMGLELDQKLASSAVTLLLEQLGISQYLLDEKCDIKRAPYSSHINGWRNDCPKSLKNLPKLPEGLVCHLGETCTEINCCFHVEFLDMSFHAFLNIDTCDFYVEAGIETRVVKYSLLEEITHLNKGIDGKVKISDFFQLGYGIRKTDKTFLIDLTIKVCFDQNKCQIDLPVMVGTQIPQFTCTLDVKGFSLSGWALSRGIDLTQHLTKQVVRFLLEQLGITDQLLDHPCSRDSLKYQPSDPNNWKNDCANMENLPAIKGPVNCYIPDYCTGINCCIDNNLLDLTINTYLYIDTCNYVINGAIEKIQFKYSILEYDWGTHKVEKLSELIFINYRIDRLVNDEIYIVDLNIKLCLQGSTECELNVTIYNQTRLPIPLCGMVKGFKVKDFSLKSWVEERGGDLTVTLSNQLIDYLGITEYLHNQPCNIFTEPFKTATTSNGWKNDCPKNLTLSTLPDNIGCYIPDYCTGVICCTNIHQIRRTFQTYLLLDNCNYQMSVGIEKLNFNISLINYQWGKEEMVDIGGIFTTRFSVEDLKGEDEFIVNMKLSACFAAGDDCNVEIPVFKDTRIPKIHCDWNKISNKFSLSSWLKEQAVSVDDELSNTMVDKLLDTLGMASYLQSPMCNHSAITSSSTSRGWNNECPVEIQLPDLPSDLTCNIPQHCTGISCCVYVPYLRRSFNILADVNMCTHTMTLGVENFKIKISLVNYKWGQSNNFNLKSVVRLDYAVYNLEGENELLLSMNVSECFESNKTCKLSHMLLKNARLPIQQCKWNSTIGKQGFSLSNFMKDENVQAGDVISDLTLSKMFEILGISSYLLHPKCDLNRNPYKHSDFNGWTSDCPVTGLNFSMLPNYVRCHVPDFCTGVSCCTNVPVIGYSFNMKLYINACDFTLMLSIENLVYKQSLLHYKWGNKEQFNINGIIGVEYVIHHLEGAKAYLISLTTAFCFDTPCLKIPVLQNARLPILECNFGKDDISEFSLSAWLTDNGVSAEYQMTPVLLSKLLDDIGISKYLNKRQCDTTKGDYTDAVDGWRKDQQNISVMLPLPEDVACNLPADIPGVRCCFSMAILNRWMEIFVFVDPCNFILKVGIEQYQFNRSLIGYQWGSYERFTLRGVINVDFVIDDLRSEKMYLLNLNLSVCLEANESCVRSFPVLRNSRIPRQVCDWDTTSSVNDFEISKWLDEQNSGGLTKLTPVLSAKLFEKLEISRFIKPTNCIPINDNTTGWSNECSLFKQTLPDLPEHVTCQIGMGCTSVECCLNVDYLHRSFSISLDVNMCEYTITTAIDNLVLRRKLFDFPWGDVQNFYLKGVVRLDYVLSVVEDERMIEISVNISVCLTNDSCLIVNQILDKQRFSQPQCNYKQSLQINKFSLRAWKLRNRIPNGVSLSEVMVSKLLEQLDLSIYLKKPECKTDEPLYLPANIKHWKKECSSNTSVAVLPENTVCYWSSDCSTIDCCYDVNIIKRSVNIRISVDTCNLEMTFTIERLSYTLSLFDYKWGKVGVFHLKGRIQIRYRLEKASNNQILLDYSLRVCFENNECVIDSPILQQAVIPYTPCNRDHPTPFKGITFDFWSLKPCKLTPTAQRCSIRLAETISDVCRLNEDCMGLSCCIQVDNKYFRTAHLATNFNVDACENKLTYSVENKEWEKTLNTLPLDSNITESIGEAISISYQISEVDGIYVISLHVKICVTYNNNTVCKYRNILDQKSFIKPECSGPRKRRSTTKQTLENDFKTGLKQMLKQGASNAEIKMYIDELMEEEDISIQRNLEPDWQDGGQANNMRSALKTMGSSNPASLLYTTTHADINEEIDGGVKLVKMLGKSNMENTLDRVFIVGKGLTEKGVKLLGLKLANMTIGEVMSLIDTKNIDPDTSIRLVNDLRDLALSLYSEIIDKVLGGQASNVFKSNEVKIEGDFSFPRQEETFFEASHGFLLGGFIFVNFRFSVGCTYGMKITIGARIMKMSVYGEAVPFGALLTTAEISVGFILYGSLRLEGYILETSFPTRAEIGFSKFPLDITLTMDVVLVPLRLRLMALVLIRFELPYVPFTIEKILFKANIWEYTAPSYSARMIDYGSHEEDKTPPSFSEYTDKKSARRKRAAGEPINTSTRHCSVRQLPDRDYTEPAIEISVRSDDDKSQVRLFVTAGTKPGLDDALAQIQIGGPSSIITTVLEDHATPIYFTVVGKNSAGAASTVTCSIPTYDITLPSGRLQSEFTSSSNPRVLRASVVVYEDSELVYSALGVGFGRGIFGDEIVPWTPINLRDQEVHQYDSSYNDPHGHKAALRFTSSKKGRLIAPKAKSYGVINFIEACMKKCLELPPSKCLSINYDYGANGTCELVEGIEGHNYKLAISGNYFHAERLGIGLAHEFIYDNRYLLHDHMYYFNMDLKNVFGYRNIISTQGVLIDITPPVPGEGLMNATGDNFEKIPCLQTIPSDRTDWDNRCIDQSDLVENHRTIIDATGSRTVFNGHEPLVDGVYFRTNRFISANWDGIHDKESGLLGYSFTAGHKICEELIHPHHDPHRHLFDESEWTHTGTIQRNEDNPLPDGKYYVTVRALNKVGYGGPLVTTFCHSTPYVIDNSKPFVHEVFNVDYEEETTDLSAEYSATDPESGINKVDICLGNTTKDCYISDWKRYPHSGQIIHNTSLPGGVPVWTKIRAWNNVELSAIKSSDHPLVIDTTPPVPGRVLDGIEYKHDQDYSRYDNKMCANWVDFYDPESGIGYFTLYIRSNVTDEYVTNGTDYDHRTHQVCVDLIDTVLQHGQVYYTELWAFNAGHIQLNTSARSNGVFVDLTSAVKGQIIDGLSENFTDLKYSSAIATISTQWRNHSDPESSIKFYEIKMLRKSNTSSEIETVRDWHELNNSTEFVEYHNFHLKHGDHVKSKLKTTNGALGQIVEETDGYIVDLTPPRLIYLNDSFQQDIEYQSNETVVQASFKFIDEESGIEYYKYQVYQTKEGSQHQMYPETDHTWVHLKDPTSQQLSVENLQLETGIRYNVRLAAVNGAGSVATYYTNGFLIDKTPPTMISVHVGVFSGEEENPIDGYVYQADKAGIKATWFAIDDVSGIKDYLVSVGTTKGGHDISDWRSFGRERAGYIDGLTLEVNKHKSPVYYVNVKARDESGLQSTNYNSSKPIIVVKEDQTGVVFDGPEGTGQSSSKEVDMDYQRETGTVTVQFSGFESEQHCLSRFDWAIGTKYNREEVQPFLTAGLFHNETVNIPGNGIASSGYGQTTVSLEPGVTYYTTVRGITNAGHVLESTSDGFTVDITPPVIKINSFSDKHTQEGDNIYQSEVDSIDIKWNIDDPESGIYNMYYTVGTYPDGTDVKPKTPIQQLLTGNGSLPVGQVKPNTDGQANIVTIWGENNVGLKGGMTSANLIVDTTPPTEGRVLCPKFIQPHASPKCTWDGFDDAESNVVEFSFALGSAEGLVDIIKPIPLPGHRTHYSIEFPMRVTHNEVYYAIVTAKNSVGKTISAVSDGITVDVTPPLEGKVIELNAEYIMNVTSDRTTRLLNPYSCNTIEECASLDDVCQESMSSINIAWSPFIDRESNIIQYELAVGTTPGGGDIKPYHTVSLQKRYLTMENIMLKGLRKVYVSVKATNGAGLSTVSVSNGIHMSYVSQGLEPLSHVGIWDGHHKHGDVDYQTSVDTIHCQWDVSGDPCPVVKYEWAIERIDGQRVQNFTETNGLTRGVNDQLEMKNGERYYCLLRVRNAGGFTYIIRSNGVTIEEEPLLPGFVNDGDIIDYDLNFVYTNNKISANWGGFGDLKFEGANDVEVISGNSGVYQQTQQKRNQDIEYYEVAVGNDRRFPKTRYNVVPFTHVGLNTSVTFYDVNLVPITATYYFTVRAYSKSMSMAEVTSNGFKVGYNDGVSGGVIDMPDYIKSDSVVDIQWEGFSSRVGMFLYYVAVSTRNNTSYIDCKQLVEGESITDEERKQICDVKDILNIGKDTFVQLQNLTLQQKQDYYAVVIGVDNAGYCKMINHRFQVDLTPPSSGKIKVGPYYDMKMSYVSTPDFLKVDWMNFTDDESGLKCYRISLLGEESCDVGASRVVIVSAIEIDTSNTNYRFMDLTLMPGRPYMIQLEVENKAGLTIQVETPPVLYDISTPTAGHVVDGFNYTDDVVWIRSTSIVKGSILQLQSGVGSSCPSRNISFIDPEWQYYVSMVNYDSSGTRLNLKYREANVYLDKDRRGELEIKLAKDDKTETMFSGAYYRDADMNNGGTYEFKLRAADGDGKAVTSIIFWDGPIKQITDYDYTKERDWTLDVCSCCKVNQTDPNCLKTCNCSNLLRSNNLVKRSVSSGGTDNPSWSVQDITEEERAAILADNSTADTTTDSSGVKIESHRSCGIQIMAGELQKIVTWCRYKNDLYRPMKTERKLAIDPSVSFNTYKMEFYVVNEDALAGSWCLNVYVNNDEVSQLCGVPRFTTDTKVFFSVRNWKNFLSPPPTANGDQFNVWTARAIFKDLILPPDKNALCRFGEPFRGGNIAIVRYEAGIGRMKNNDSISVFREVLSPCIPCQSPCDRYICQSNCSSHQLTQYNISIQSLDLPPTETVDGVTKPISYILTVKAVLGSGKEAISSSNGFYIDITPPVFEEDVLLYIDVDQGNFTPVTYQGSNSTIKSIWSCQDNDSMIAEYLWGIGRYPGSLDIQSLISVGVNQSGTNNNLSGILENNSTYYVTIKCINGAGLETIYEDRKGVTVLLNPPNIEDVGTNMTNVEPFDQPVTPNNAMKTSEDDTIGCSWTISEDQSLREYDICIGSSEAVCDDILPCTWVGYNVSGDVAIHNGWLMVNGVKFRTIGAFHPMLNETSIDNTSSTFKMEPGRTMFLCMRMCNEARRCTIRLVGSSVVVRNNSKVATSTEGESLKINLQSSSSSRKKRAVEDVSLQTPSNLKPGQSIIITELEEIQLSKYYTSDAAPEFISFITNPVDTINTKINLHRLLVHRVKLKPQDKHFSVTSVGHLELPGPLLVTIKYNPLNTDSDKIPSLLHWNPVQQKWMLSSKSCSMTMDTRMINETIGEVHIKVCNTRNPDNQPGNSDVYFSKDTQFMISDILKVIPNTAPKLISTKDITMAEDSGTLLYEPDVYDAEGDDIKIVVDSLSTDNLGDVNITPSGLLLYLPCQDCTGQLQIQIRITEIQSPDIQPMTTVETLTISILSTNDAPIVFSISGNMNILHSDSTEPVMILLEQNHQLQSNKHNFTWMFGVYDVDDRENLTLYVDYPHNGTLKHNAGFKQVPTCGHNDNMLPCSTMDLPHPVDDMSWLYYTMTYTPDDDVTGYDMVRLYVTDNQSLRSDVVTIQMAMMKMPCINGGTCEPKSINGNTYDCQDIRRAANFYDYYTCKCPHGWSGVNCEEEINECQSSPCDWPYVCYDLINKYQCACPEDEPNCDSLVGWMIALIVIAVVLVIIMTFLVSYCCAFKRGRSRWFYALNRFVPEPKTDVTSLALTDIEPEFVDVSNNNSQ